MGTWKELMAQMLYDLWLLKIQVSLCNVILYMNVVGTVVFMTKIWHQYFIYIIISSYNNLEASVIYSV